MNRSILLPAAYLTDQLCGDPEWLPHPVRLIGFAVARADRALNLPNQKPADSFASGAALTVTIVASTYWITLHALHFAYRRSIYLGNAMELLLAWTCLAGRNLEEEADAVIDAVQTDDLLPARHRLARIVGRDTAHLETAEISRAVIETVAESASDGILAPMFYMAIGGVPLSMAYKAINTLDSMIGHADARYLYFGKTAARLDDIANFLPARLTALCIVAASPLVASSHARAAWRTWRRDGGRHKSPNAGQPESAMSGALQTVLGGDNLYAGELVKAQLIGYEFEAATPERSRQAVRLVAVASIIGLGFGVAATVLLQTRKRR